MNDDMPNLRALIDFLEEDTKAVINFVAESNESQSKHIETARDAMRSMTLLAHNGPDGKYRRFKVGQVIDAIKEFRELTTAKEAE